MLETNGLKQTLKKLGWIFSENSPTILTSLAVGGVITTAVLAVKATPRACGILTTESEFKNIDEQLTKQEIIQLTWKLYLPAIGVGVATIACIICANTINLRRNAALGAVYSITEAALKEYQSKVVETIGKNKEIKLRDEIAKDHIIANPVGSNEVIFTGKGDVPCYDSFAGRHFESNIESIRRAENTIDHNLRDEMFISLNDLYYELGLAPTKLGDLMGWHIDDGRIEFNYSSQLSEDGRPILVFDYVVTPKFYK